MKNKNNRGSVAHRKTFLTRIDVHTLKRYSVVKVANIPNFNIRFRKTYPNRKRNLQRSWKSLEWTYDEV